MAREAFSKTFTLDKTILGVNSSGTIDVSVRTDADVVDAIVNGKPFPPRPDGEIALGRIDLTAQANKAVTFGNGDLQVSFSASAGMKTGAGVYDDPARAIAALDIEAPEALKLKINPPKDASGNEIPTRYIAMEWGWNAGANVAAKHPIGMLGSVTFGADAKTNRLYAVLHAFPSTALAHDALTDTFSSWRLPRHLAQKARLNDEIAPATWIIAEAEGSVALSIAAQLGYDFKIARDAELLGVTRQLSAKIDAGIRATFGLTLSGRYFIVVARESDKADVETLRLQLFKQSRRGLNFGLNLSAGITNTTPLPANADDFVKGVFGVHGLQVIKDLHLIEKWTDPQKDLSDTAARLLRDTGLDLLTRATHIDARKEFEQARGVILGLLAKWDALPEKAAAAIWEISEKSGDNLDVFKKLLAKLADNDPKVRRDILEQVLIEPTFGNTPAGKFLGAIADQGLLALTQQLDAVQRIAAQALAVLDGDFLRDLQKFINEKLDLTKIKAELTEEDFDTLSDWLVRRLSDFLDEDLGFAKLQEITNSINAVVQLRNKVYDQIKKAASTRYGAELAVAYQRTNSGSALLDVEFNLKEPAARKLFQDVVQQSNLDALLTQSTPGVSLHQAALTHETERKLNIDIHLPYWSRSEQRITDSLAKLNVESDADRVLIYELNAKNTVTVANRFKSQLSVLAGLRAKNGKLEAADGSVSYELRQAKADMKFADLEQTVTPFLSTYLSDLFPGPGSSIHTFLFDLDRTVENLVGNGPNEFGDVLLQMQLAAPARLLASWFEERTNDQIKVAMMRVSRNLQARLRQLLPFFYFQDLDNAFQNAPAAALLVWSALPVSTSIRTRDGALVFNTDEDVFWNFPDQQLRRMMAADAHTGRSLAPKLALLQQRLREAGLTKRAQDFDPMQTSSFQSLTTSEMGAVLFNSLLFTESQLIKGVAKCLRKIQEFRADLATAPTKAVPELASFGAALVDTFSSDLGVYGSNALRPLGSMLLLETAAVLEGVDGPEQQQAMLSIAVLKENRTFNIGDFVGGSAPESKDIAVTQTLVS